MSFTVNPALYSVETYLNGGMSVKEYGLDNKMQINHHNIFQKEMNQYTLMQGHAAREAQKKKKLSQVQTTKDR